MNPHIDLIAALEAKQRAEPGKRRPYLSDADFAQRLGISRQLWSLHRRTGAPLSRRTMEAVLRVYPDLTQPVLRLFLLPPDAKKSTTAASDVAEERVAV